MESIKIEKLRIAANQFYLNKYMDQPTIPDKEFDELRKEYESEGNNMYSLVEWEGQKRKNELPIGLDKIVVEDNNLSNYVTEYLTNQCKEHGYNPNELTPDGFNICDYVPYYMNYKYDGCSILGIYENGRLKEVRSTPDEEYGIVRTKAFVNIFPEVIKDKDVIALQGEALVDYRAYGQLARNKANGLVNSIYKDEEVANEIFVRIYKVYWNEESQEFHNKNEVSHFYHTINVLNTLPKIRKNRERLGDDGMLHSFDDLVFAPARRFIASQCPTDALVTPHGWDGSEYFQVDGVVLYSELETKAFKFYYTESAITTVTDIEWNIQANGGWAPKVIFDPITLNDKNIQRAASGGVPNMLWMKFGVGAKIKVILANMTIPKIVDVIEPSENYKWPTCSCSYQISEKDIFGSGVKCQSTHCDRRKEQWLEELVAIHQDKCNRDGVLSPMEYFDKYTIEILGIVIHIDRWYAPDKWNKVHSESEIKEAITSCIQLSQKDTFKMIIEDNFNMSGLQHANMIANYGPAFDALRTFLSL